MAVDLRDLLTSSTVRLRTIGGGLGTGFFVAPGLLLTCSHVLQNVGRQSTRLKVEWDREDRPVLEIVELQDPEYPDLALVRVKADDHPCVLLDEEIGHGDLVYTYGYTKEHRGGEPEDLTYVGRANVDLGGTTYFHKFADGWIVRGYSGSPLLNVRTGGVCGMVKKTAGEHAALGGAGIPTEIIFRELPQLVELNAAFHRQNSQWTDATPADRNGETLYLAKPKIDEEPDVLRIPAGPFIMGSDHHNPEESPQHTVDLHEYYIGEHPVTNYQYAQFVWNTGIVVGSSLLWDGQSPPEGELDYPVTGVTWHEALEYCDWLREISGRNYTLPTEAQWEKAARGVDGRLYPWGDRWDQERCNNNLDRITPVLEYEAQSEFGCFDMIGNTREWTTTVWGKLPDAPDDRYRYPWKNDGRDYLNQPSTVRRVYRGGRGSNPVDFRCSIRGGYLPNKPGPRRNRHGFRVALP